MPDEFSREQETSYGTGRCNVEEILSFLMTLF